MKKKLNAKLITAAFGGAAMVSAYIFLMRPWHLRWGATTDEVSTPLPGDELVQNTRLNATHAIIINAPASTIWSWLVQIGENRGGFYSYSWLENLVGCHIA